METVAALRELGMLLGITVIRAIDASGRLQIMRDLVLEWQCSRLEWECSLHKGLDAYAARIMCSIVLKCLRVKQRWYRFKSTRLHRRFCQ